MLKVIRRLATILMICCRLSFAEFFSGPVCCHTRKAAMLVFTSCSVHGLFDALSIAGTAGVEKSW
jgi:hypothetical protein